MSLSVKLNSLELLVYFGQSGFSDGCIGCVLHSCHMSHKMLTSYSVLSNDAIITYALVYQADIYLSKNQLQKLGSVSYMHKGNIS